MEKVKTAGGVLLRDERILLVVHRKGGHVFPKGHVEDGETAQETAVREVMEETGVSVDVIRLLGVVTRVSREHSGETVEKDIDLFLMQMSGNQQPGVTTDEESAWVPLQLAAASMRYPAEAAFLIEHLPELMQIGPQ
ncbi:MAG TPA: NUDIX domain-containing protein [Nevskiaceae bacterium]|nr:NUDIX domain-containing protein [Nevskiaceae bacterium]